jgi:hypothetical protein
MGARQKKGSSQQLADHARKHTEKLTFMSFGLRIDDAHAQGKSGSLSVVATQTVPSIYLFQLDLADRAGQRTYYANKYVLDSSQANVIGPVVHAGKVEFVIARLLTRISYDVPNELRSATPAAPASGRKRAKGRAAALKRGG